MPTIAVLLGTSRTGSEIILSALRDSSASYRVHAVVRSTPKFYQMHPQYSPSNANVPPNLFVHAVDFTYPKTLEPALQDADTIFISVGGDEFRHPCTISLDVTASTLACIASLPKRDKKSKIVLLSAGWVNKGFQRTSPRTAHFIEQNIFRWPMYDLRLAQQLLEKFSDLVEAIFVQPGMLVSGERTEKWEIKEIWGDNHNPLTYADLADAMLAIGAGAMLENSVEDSDKRSMELTAVSLVKPNVPWKDRKSQLEVMRFFIGQKILLPLTKYLFFLAVGIAIGGLKWQRKG